MRRAHTVLFMLGMLLALASAVHAQECQIVFEGGGESRTFSSNDTIGVIDVEGPWDFIRSTRGLCTFRIFDDTNLSGRSVLYGTDINERIRIGATGAQESGGWGARSLRITRHTVGDCAIVLGDAGVSQTFVGPGADLTDISGWNFVRTTTSPPPPIFCVFQVFNGHDLSGNTVSYGAFIDQRIRAGATGGQDSGGWRIRSLRIRRIEGGGCAVRLGDGGISQVFGGPDEVERISSWNFVRRSTGGCPFTVFNGSHFDGRQRTFGEDVTAQVRVGWRIRSLRVLPPR